MKIIGFCNFKLILPQENKEANNKQLTCSAWGMGKDLVASFFMLFCGDRKNCEQ